MDRIRTAVFAFSARSTEGRRGVLLAYSGLVTLVLVGLAYLISRGTPDGAPPIDTLALADMFAMMLAGAALLVVAPAMVAAQVGEELRSGTLDLLRTAPLSPTALAVGFVSGAPASLYLVLVGPLVLHVLAALSGTYPLSALPESLFVLGLGSVALMLVSMLAALAIGREGPAGATPMLVAGVLGIAAMTTVAMAADPGSSPWAFVHPAGALAAIYCGFDGPFRQAFVSSWRLDQFAEAPLAALRFVAPIFSALVYLVGGAIFLVAARRALAGDPPSRFSKGEAISLVVLATLAITVPLRIVSGGEPFAHRQLVAVAMSLAPVFFACVLGATPSAAGYGDGSAARLSPRGAPLLAASLMLLASLGVMTALFGTSVIRFLVSDRVLPYFVGYSLVGLTLPIYSLYLATQLSTVAGRLSFWAVTTALTIALFPAFFVLNADPTTREVPYLLAQIAVAVGTILPLAISWRQRVGDRARAARAV